MSQTSGHGGNSALQFRDRWEVVYDALRERILNGDLAPGEQIKEVEIAQAYGVSRGPVREAIRELETSGLVLRGPRQPSFVAPVSTRDVNEVYALRGAVEALAVREAITVGSEMLAATLPARTKAFGPSEHAALDLIQLVEADMRFHSTFYEASENKRLISVWGSITDPLRSMMRIATHRSDPHWKESYESHVAIAAASLEGDIDSAIAMTTLHIEEGRRYLMNFIEVRAAE